MCKRKWKKLPPIKSGDLNVRCFNCSTAAYKAPMDKIICTGFGMAVLLKNGQPMVDGEGYADENEGKYLTFKDAESMAEKDSDNDWQVIMAGPLHGETYQRHGKKNWVCVESNPGFA